MRQHFQVPWQMSDRETLSMYKEKSIIYFIFCSLLSYKIIASCLSKDLFTNNCCHLSDEKAEKWQNRGFDIYNAD